MVRLRGVFPVVDARQLRPAVDQGVRLDCARRRVDDESPQLVVWVGTVLVSVEQCLCSNRVLSSPVTLPANATSGAAIHVSLTGALTIHGTTKTVQARLSGSEIELVGSISFAWGEFNMQAPNIGGFVTVNSTATMEFDLFLKHS